MATGRIIAGAGAAALLIATPFIAGWEGKRNAPYFDNAGIATVCFGETRVPMRRYTDAECEAMLKKGVAEFMGPVAEMTPTIRDKPNTLAATTSLAYNIGLANYRNSTARRRFLAGDIKGGCNAFAPWHNIRKGGKLVPLQGLKNRRAAEIKLCLKDS